MQEQEYRMLVAPFVGSIVDNIDTVQVDSVSVHFQVRTAFCTTNLGREFYLLRCKSEVGNTDAEFSKASG